MKRWQQHLLDGYRWATWPCRRALAEHLQRQARAPVMVLFYHRIAETPQNGWTLPFAEFQRQLLWIRERFELIGMEEAQCRLKSRENTQPAVSITFDDGYADNQDHALPWLIEQEIPCTYFVTWRNIVEGSAFPHDQAAGHELPPNSLADVRQLADAGVEIGCHTRTHPDLGAIQDAARLRDEVVTVREEMQQALGRPIRYFAFPYGLHGNLNARAFALAKEAGYAGVCSAYGGYNLPGDDPFHLQRIHADGEFARFRNWLTLDPRKLRTPRYDYGTTGGVTPVGTP